MHILRRRGWKAREIAQLIPGASESSVVGRMTRRGLYLHPPTPAPLDGLSPYQKLKQGAGA